jgi:hypothetical protein
VIQLARCVDAGQMIIGSRCLRSPLTFDSRDCRSLDTCASIVLWIVLADKDFNRVGLRQHDSSFIHVVHVLLQHIRILERFVDGLKPLCHLVTNLITLPVQRSTPSRLKFWMTFAKGPRPVLTRRLAWSICWGPSLSGKTERDRGYMLDRTERPRASCCAKSLRRAFSSHG